MLLLLSKIHSSPLSIWLCMFASSTKRKTPRASPPRYLTPTLRAAFHPPPWLQSSASFSRRASYESLRGAQASRHSKFEPIRFVRYLDDEDIFEVEFDSGETFCVDHAEVRRANGLSGQSDVDSVWIDAAMRAGFLMR